MVHLDGKGSADRDVGSYRVQYLSANGSFIDIVVDRRR